MRLIKSQGKKNKRKSSWKKINSRHSAKARPAGVERHEARKRVE